MEKEKKKQGKDQGDSRLRRQRGNRCSQEKNISSLVFGIVFGSMKFK